MTSRSLCFAVIFFALHGGILHAQDDTVADFKAKAISEWSALSERVASSRGEVTRESYFSQNRQPLWLRGRHHYKYGFRQGTGMFTELEMEDFDQKGVSTKKYHLLNIANEHYSAELTWKKGGEGWSLTNLKMGRDREAFEKVRDTTAVLPWLMICDNVAVPELVRDPGFVISRIEQRAGSPGSKPLRVRFRNEGWQPPHESAIQCVHSGFIDFDAGHSYRIMGYEIHWKGRFSEGDRKGVMEYEEGKGIPILKVMVQKWPEQNSKKRGLMSSKNTTSLKYTYNSGPSDEEFRLSHYGLPEPKGVPQPESPPRTWLWLLAAAVGAGLLAILFAWLKRRRVAASQARAAVTK